MTGGWGAVLAPGAGAGRDQSALVAIDQAVTALGGVARRFDFPYRLAGRRAPDRPKVLVATVKEEATALAAGAGLGPQRIFAGGRSMGGRMCSMAVAEGMPCAGLVLVSYPLHPPGRPQDLRTAHFPALAVPCLFVSGSRDAFASPAELEAEASAIPGPVTFAWVDGADHGMRGRDGAVATAVRAWLEHQLPLLPTWRPSCAIWHRPGEPPVHDLL